MVNLSRRNMLKGLGVGSAGLVGGGNEAREMVDEIWGEGQIQRTSADTVAADPTAVPDPIDRPGTTEHHEITLECVEVTAEIEPGVEFNYMTFGGQVPGPLIRVREGDTVDLTMENPPENAVAHNVDFHAVYGTGGGSVATTAAPGEENSMRFKAMYPGVYIYHCAVKQLDYHIASGMYGAIVVEPREGLPEVDHEFYFGQNEVYTDKDAGEEGTHNFDFQAMEDENPTYVLLNGEKYAYAASNRGPLEVETGDTARVFMVTGGPNLTSNFHPIGNVWSKAWPEGSLLTEPEINVQTKPVAPGSCFVGTMEFPVPERVKLVDHALSRVARKGMMAEIDVKGEKRNDIFDPEVDGDDEGPIYGSEDGDY